MIHLRLLAIALALGTCPAPAAAQAQPADATPSVATVTLAVKGMYCGLCSPTVKKALSKVPGVIDAKVDFDKQTAVVTYDTAKTDVGALTKATTHAGFPSTVKP